MKLKKRGNLHALVRPYTFVLQEGHAIKHNYLDYSLKLCLGRPEFIPTPFSAKKNRSI